MQLVIDVCSCQWHLTLKYFLFLKEYFKDTTVQDVQKTVALSVSNANEKKRLAKLSNC